jgi:hypothetical protein
VWLEGDRLLVRALTPFRCADRDYRDGIFRLETLRLQRTRIQNSALQELREFAMELSSNLRRICESNPAVAKAMVTATQTADGTQSGLMLNSLADGEEFAQTLCAPVPESPVYCPSYLVPVLSFEPLTPVTQTGTNLWANVAACFSAYLSTTTTLRTPRGSFRSLCSDGALSAVSRAFETLLTVYLASIAGVDSYGLELEGIYRV